MARHNHRQSDRRSEYTADSLQTVPRPRSLSPRRHHHQNRPHHNHRVPVKGQSPSPLTGRRSHSAPRRSRRHHRRSTSPPPSSRRERSRYRDDRRRHLSCDTVDTRHRRSPSPRIPRGRYSGGRFTHQLLKILASSAGTRNQKKKHLIRERSLSWSNLRPRRYTPDHIPLIDPNEMPGRSPTRHFSHVQRAREEAELERIRRIREEAAENERLRRIREEATETERLRKIREDAAEAERRRMEVEEEARRIRRQQELDEAELRRQRALDQLNESDRQRRDLEDRLRHLEDQDFDVVAEKKRSTSKRCCRAFKIMFGIGLSLGLVFVFYLIVASIVGQPTPFDMFSYSVPEDTYVNQDVKNIEVPNVTTEKTTDKTEPDYYTTTYSTENIDRIDYGKNDGDIYDDSKIYFETENNDEYGDYRDGEGLDNYYDGSERKSVETFQLPPPRFSDHYPSILSVDQQGIPSETVKHIKNFDNLDNSKDFGKPIYIDELYNNNYPQIRNVPSNVDVSFINENIGDRSVPGNSYTNTDNRDWYQSTLSPYQYLVPTSVSVDNFTPRIISTQRSGLPDEFGSQYGNIPTQKTVRELEQEIIKTIRELRQDKHFDPRRKGPIRMVPIDYDPRKLPLPVNVKVPPARIARGRSNSRNKKPVGRRPRIPIRMGSPIIGSPSIARPGIRANPFAERMLPYHPSLRNPQYRNSRSTEKSNRRFRKSRSSTESDVTGRRSRNSNSHTAPPEFRYPRTAGSIQDIINYMNKEDQDISYNRPFSTLKPNYKVGRQDHILAPDFISDDEEHGYHDDDPMNTRRHDYGKHKYKYKYKHKGKGEHVHVQEIPLEFASVEAEYGPHDDHSYHTQYEHKPPPRPPSHDYLPPIYNKKPDILIPHLPKKPTPFKIILDVYPVIKKDKHGKKYVKYESKYSPHDVYTDDSYHRSFDTYNRKYDDDDHLYSSDRRSYRPEQSFTTSKYQPDFDSSIDSRTGYRYDSRAAADYERYFESGQKRDNPIEIKSSHDKTKHTITLHINLFSKKPDYAPQGTRRVGSYEDRVDREAALEIPLTKKFSIFDIYSALMNHLERDTPYAQHLVGTNKNAGSSRELENVQLFDIEGKSSLLEALENSFSDLNTKLPEDLKLQLLKNANLEESGSNNIYKYAVERNGKSYNFTEGFEFIDVRKLESQELKVSEELVTEAATGSTHTMVNDKKKDSSSGSE